MTILPRLQGFEFCDQAWLPDCLRECHMDCLSLMHRLYQPYWKLFKPILDWTEKNTLLDLASGSGEHVAQLIRAAQTRGAGVPSVVLSDIRPDIDSYKKLKNEFGSETVRFVEQPLPVSHVQSAEQRYWTIFTSFHHLGPSAAQEFLSLAASKADGLCIAEVTRRNALDLILIPLGLPVQMLAPLISGRFTWTKFLFTTLIPIIPFIVIFDCIVSALRSYSKEEIIAFFPPEQLAEFNVEYREAYWRFAPLKSSVLLLTRKTARHAPQFKD